jgi:hypothetical protein
VPWPVLLPGSGIEVRDDYLDPSKQVHADLAPGERRLAPGELAIGGGVAVDTAILNSQALHWFGADAWLNVRPERTDRLTQFFSGLINRHVHSRFVPMRLEFVRLGGGAAPQLISTVMSDQEAEVLARLWGIAPVDDPTAGHLFDRGIADPTQLTPYERLLVSRVCSRFNEYRAYDYVAFGAPFSDRLLSGPWINIYHPVGQVHFKAVIAVVRAIYLGRLRISEKRAAKDAMGLSRRIGDFTPLFNLVAELQLMPGFVPPDMPTDDKASVPEPARRPSPDVGQLITQWPIASGDS